MLPSPNNSQSTIVITTKDNERTEEENQDMTLSYDDSQLTNNHSGSIGRCMSEASQEKMSSMHEDDIISITSSTITTCSPTIINTHHESVEDVPHPIQES